MHRRDKLLERRLKQAYGVEPPESLYQRLIEIPDNVPQPEPSRARSRRRTGWLNFQWQFAVPALSVAAAVAVLWTAGVRINSDQPVLITNEVAATTQQHQAVRDFVTVMTYLQASTALVNRGVQKEVGAGLITAFERGEQSFKDSSNRVTNGG